MTVAETRRLLALDWETKLFYSEEDAPTAAPHHRLGGALGGPSEGGRRPFHHAPFPASLASRERIVIVKFEGFLTSADAASGIRWVIDRMPRLPTASHSSEAIAPGDDGRNTRSESILKLNVLIVRAENVRAVTRHLKQDMYVQLVQGKTVIGVSAVVAAEVGSGGHHRAAG